MFCEPMVNKPGTNEAYERKLRLFMETSNISLFIDAVKEYYGNKCECVGFYFSYDIENIPNLMAYHTKEVVYFSFSVITEQFTRRIDLVFDDNFLLNSIEKHEWDNNCQSFIELKGVDNVELKYSRYVLAG